MADPHDPARKYILRTVLFMGAYIAVNIAAMTGAFDDMRPPGTWLFALAAAAPIVGHVWAVLAYMRDSDEFVGGLMARRFVIATGISIAVVSSWGLMEEYAGAVHFPAIMLYPLVWAAFGLVTPFVRSTR
jgi:putative oxidoreductase